MFNLLKHVSRRFAPGLYARLAQSYQSFRAQPTLKAWLKNARIFPRLAPLWFYFQQRLNTIKSLAAFRPFLHALRPRFPTRLITSEKPLEIVMLAISNMRFDPRVQREAQALARGGYHVKIIVPDNHTPPLAETPLNWGPGIEFVLLPWQAASYIMSYPFLLGRIMLDYAIKENPFAFHCHDLTTAVIGLAAARKVGTRCVCDFHEWWSEMSEWNYIEKKFVDPLPKTKRFFKFAERFIMSRADAVITVCDSIAHELEKNVKGSSAEITVIRNIPDLNPSPNESDYRNLNLRELFGLQQEQQLVIYQGGVGPSRNLEPVIDALAYAPRTVLVIRGPAIEHFAKDYQARAALSGVQDRLFCLDPVPSADVVAAAAASGAVAGLYTVGQICLSWVYALPNKIFEYMVAGLPILTADYPEVRKLVDHYEIGIVFDPDDPHSIAAAFNRFATEPYLVASMRSRLAAALSDLDAEMEWQKIVDLYDGLAAGSEL